MIQTLKNAWKVPEIRSKIWFTLLVVLLYRLGAQIPVPFLNADLMESFGSQMGGLFEYMNLLSGGAFAQGTLFALNVSPYITASIVIQLLTIALPPLERWAKDGEAGRKKISALTRVVTVALALVTSIGYTMLLDAGYQGQSYLTADGQSLFGKIVIVACFCAGSSVIMWLAEKINEFGIGNGISMILFANILSRGGALLGSVWGMTFTKGNFDGFSGWGLVKSILSLMITVAIIFLIVWFTESERRIPIQYAKRQVGRKMYGGQSSNLPLKMNMAGVMPVIFASSIVSIPATIATFITNEENWFYKFANNWFNYDTWLYLVVYIVLIFLFSYFYIMISFNPVEVANNIRNQGGSVPGIRPGKPTSDYITRILGRITTLGAIFLAFIAGFPMLITIIFGDSFSGIAFGGTSLLIVVGVALETFRAIESQLAMRNYKGFLD
ncbi:MAG: preprotein translocase subunit SecY [Clostridia bacterium]|nr:preprotein translocase subunit SecY [Clostridia bacterium]